MKKLIALLMALLLIPTALAEGAFDDAELQRTPNTRVYQQPGTVDTIVRLMNQPYMGEVDEGELYIYIDYVKKVDLDATLIRLYVALTVYEPLRASQVAITVGGTRYVFDMDCSQSEYDGIYMEDYVTCLTDASLPLLKALAQQKQDAPLAVEFFSFGEVVLTARIILPGQDAAYLYDRYIDLGGKQQPLKKLDATFPCTVEKVQ